MISSAKEANLQDIGRSHMLIDPCSDVNAGGFWLNKGQGI